MMGCVAEALRGDPEGLQRQLDAVGAAAPPFLISDVTGLQTALDTKQPSGVYALVGDMIAGLAGKAALVHGHAIADVTGLQGALDAKQPVGSYAAAAHGHAGASASADGFMSSADKSKLDAIAAGATVNSTDAQLRDRTTHTGTQSLDTTADSASRVAMTPAERTKLGGVAAAATANSTDAQLRDRTTHTGTQSLDTTADSASRVAMTPAERTKLGGVATAATANSTDALLSAPYRTLLDSSGSHTAARVAGTYGFGQGDPLAIAGTGTLYPLNIIYIDPADYPAIGALAAKLRLRCNLHCNDVAPGSNFTIGLHPVTRPATSGGSGLCIYTIGSAVAGSTIAINAPAADSSTNGVASDFVVPAAGFYVIGLVTSATIATSAHVHAAAQLQMRYA
jgi:hypothetical protein